MDEFLRLHQPNDAAKERVQQAGLNLTDLKETDPERYKMMTAQEVVEVSATLVQEASAVLFAAFRHHEVFRLEHPTHVTLLVFPGLSAKDLERLETALGKLTDIPKFREQYAYFRIVSDKGGEHRQLALPISPDDWAGQSNVLVGPFANQAEAEKWGNEVVRPRDLIHDTLRQVDTWFCDVFLAE